MNAWAFGTVVLCALIWALFALADGLLDRWFRERWHDRWYQPQQAHRPPSQVIDVNYHAVTWRNDTSARVPADERALDAAHWRGATQDAGHQQDGDAAFR